MHKIIIDKNIRHGKPTIEGTRITVDEVLHMLKNGMTYDEIEKEYGLTKDHILSVIRYLDSMVHGEEVHSMSA